MTPPTGGSDEREAQEGLRASAVAGIRWTLVGRSGQAAVQLAVALLLARLLGPEAFGLVSFVLIFSGIGTVLQEMGLAAAVVQQPSLRHRQLSTVFWLSLFGGLVIAGLLAASAPLVAAFFSDPRLVPLVLAIAANLVIVAAGQLPVALLQRSMRFRDLTIVELVAASLAGCLGIAGALAGLGVWALVVERISFMTLRTSGAWLRAGYRPTREFDLRESLPLIRFGANLTGVRLLTYGFRNVDDLLVGRVLGASALGIYTRAYAFLLKPVAEIQGVLGRVMFPALAQIQHSPARTREVQLRAISVVAVVSMPGIAGLFLVAPEFVAALLGPEWEGLTPVIRWLCVGGVLHPVLTTSGWLYQAQGRTDLQLRWSIVTNTLAVVAFVVGVRAGVTGVAAAMSIWTLLVAIPTIAIPGRLVGLTPLDVLRRLRRIGLALAMMVAAVGCFRLLLLDTVTPLGALVIQVLLGAITYVGAILASGEPAVAEALVVMRPSRRTPPQ